VLGQRQHVPRAAAAAVHEDHREPGACQGRAALRHRPPRVGIAVTPRHPDRRQDALDVRPAPLVAGRQLEARAELVQGLVGGEARRVGRDLEQDAAGLAEVDRVEVLPVDHGRDVEAEGGDALAPFALDLPRLGAERDVVDRAGALPADGRGT
jgi:hypothetical protein